MTRNSDMDEVKAFVYGTNVQLQEVADAINAHGGGKEGKPIDRKAVWRYANGTRPPAWFIERLNQAFPRWREQKDDRTGKHSSTEKEAPVSSFRRRFMPVVSSIDAATMDEDLKAAQSDKWNKEEFEVMDLFGLRLPLQPIKVSDYEPAFSPLDAVLLDMDADPVMNKLYLVQAEGARFYAKLTKIGGRSVWQKYDGETLPYKPENLIAALVVFLPEYRLKSDEGIFSRLGLDGDRHIKWPKES